MCLESYGYVVKDTEKLICEVERRPSLYSKKPKEYSDRNLKDKLWYEVCKSVVTNWSELPAEQKSEKKGGTFQIFGNKSNESKFYSGRK